MGRGRAKAKQTKVARDLKYGNGETDLNALAQELSCLGSTRRREITNFSYSLIASKYS